MIIIISLHRKFKSHFANSTKMKDMQEMSGCACMGNCFIQAMRFTGLKNCISLKLLFSSIIMKPCITILSQLVNWLVLILDEAINPNEQKYTDCTKNCNFNNLSHCCTTSPPPHLCSLQVTSLNERNLHLMHDTIPWTPSRCSMDYFTQKKKTM